MKKYLYIFSIMLFFIFIPNVRADEEVSVDITNAGEKVCIYTKSGDAVIQGVLHASGKTLVFDIYRGPDESIFNNELADTFNTYTYAGVYKFSDPCPKKICENFVNFSHSVGLTNNLSCFGNWTYTLTSEKKVTDVLNGLDELLAYKYNGSIKEGFERPKSILESNCPSDVAVFKLLKTAYSLLKIIAPIALVLFATIDLAKAVVAADESAIKKAQKHCLKRIAAAVIVLLSFVIVEMIISMASGGSDVMGCVNEFFK